MGFFTSLIHLFFGFLSGFFWFIDRSYSVFLYILFVMYEYVEEEKIHDEMYKELKEFAIGFVAGSLTYLLCTSVFHVHILVP